MEVKQTAFETAMPVLPNAEELTKDEVFASLEEACTDGLIETGRSCLESWKNMATKESHSKAEIRQFLPIAVKNRHPGMVSLLLDEGLHIDCDVVKIAIASGSIETLEIFLQYGWNINQKLGPTMAPPLSQALEDTNLVRWFLAHGANPNVRIPGWPSPMDKAASKASLEVIEMLVQHGGRIQSSNVLPWAAKTSLPDRNGVIRYFLDKGVHIDALEFEHDEKIFKKYSKKAFGTALHHASKRGNVQVVSFLLQMGARRDLRDSVGKTALEYALEEDLQEVVSVFEEFEEQ